MANERRRPGSSAGRRRVAGWAGLVGLVLACVTGCSTMPGTATPGYKWSASKDAAYREAAAKDSFPTAAQAGITGVRQSR